MIVSKLDAARIQLDSAIDHYFQGDYSTVSAGQPHSTTLSLCKGSLEEFLDDFPTVSRELAVAALE